MALVTEPTSQPPLPPAVVLIRCAPPLAHAAPDRLTARQSIGRPCEAEGHHVRQRAAESRQMNHESIGEL
ncbi:hypothetical protein SSP35_29_00390 [Streptomyces sp. NBRC 110611]|nr:hypothetical protein SSP35_29_00390 [Streptomyces sp. NBRC 110611]